VGVILKLLNVNGVAQALMKGSYSGPTIAVGDDPLLKDVKLPVKTDRAKLVRCTVELTKREFVALIRHDS
jgi:hypothetical protein